jgi:hypothetical protein
MDQGHRQEENPELRSDQEEGGENKRELKTATHKRYFAERKRQQSTPDEPRLVKIRLYIGSCPGAARAEENSALDKSDTGFLYAEGFAEQSTGFSHSTFDASRFSSRRADPYTRRC